MSKKNLDKLFQEKFNSFQESPDPKVWQTIEASLNQKDKKRRIIPLWWQIGSIAAVLALGLFLINPFETNQTISPSIITDIENSEKTLDNKGVSNKDNSEENAQKVIETKKIAETNSSNSSEEKNLILSPSKNNNTSATQNVIQNNVASITSGTLIEKENIGKKTNSNKGETHNPLYSNSSENAIAQQNQKTETISTEKLNTHNQIEKALKEVEKTKNTIVGIDEQKENTAKEEVKKSIYDEIEAQKKEKEEAIAEVRLNKWSAGASVAPVYFNAIGEGSPVGEMFVSNSKSGDTNLSYGLSIAYEVSNKLSIRSGIHKVDYAYSTNNVRFSSNFNGSTNNQLSTINYDTNSINLELISTDEEAIQSFSPKDKIANDVSAKNPTREGIMSQQFDYLEVPLELKYQLVDSKFGVDIIGGVSSLFLLDNSVLLSSGNITTTLGEANNMNSLNFSTNIGIGLNYKFTPKLKLNVEPMFKYQLNTFSNTQGTFEPYSIGVYSGLTFKF